MTDLIEFLKYEAKATARGVAFKNNQIKRNVVAYMAVNGQCTLAELTAKLNVSVPTITKLVSELLIQEIVVDNGKVETSGGRRPNVYGLATTAIYFTGVSVGFDVIDMVITDLENKVVASNRITGFTLENKPSCLDYISHEVDRFLNSSSIDRAKIIGLGFAITCRVNPQTGYSHKYFSDLEIPLAKELERRLKLQVLLENDTRAMCYAEYNLEDKTKCKNFIFLNAGRGVAIGIVIDGKLYYGKSGIAGEFGHTPFFDNDIICACGKKGCLETEISGKSLETKMMNAINEGRNTILKHEYEQNGSIHIDNIVSAAKTDDTLSIELLEDAAEKIGKSLVFLINIFNPEVVLIGGNLAQAGEVIMLPIKSAVNKYSLSLVAKDTIFKETVFSKSTAALGSAMLIRNKIIGL